MTTQDAKTIFGLIAVGLLIITSACVYQPDPPVPHGNAWILGHPNNICQCSGKGKAVHFNEADSAAVMMNPCCLYHSQITKNK